MAKTYNVMKINVKDDITSLLTAKEEDLNSRYLDVYLMDNGIPIDLTGHEVRIYGRKPDGTSFFNDGEITDAVNGRCQFPITSQALAVPGTLKVEISMWQNNERILTTQTFDILVAPKIRNDDDIESSNEYGALVILFQKLYDFIADVTELLNLVGQPADTGGTTLEGTVMAKINKMIEYTQSIAQQTDSVQYRASNTLQSTDIYEFTLDDRRKYKKIKQFYAKYNGYIHVNITTKTVERIDMTIFRSLHDYLNIENGTGYRNNKHMMIPALFTAPEDSILNNFEVILESSILKSSTYSQAAEFTSQISGSNTYPDTESTSAKGHTIMDVVFPVKKGEQVVFVGYYYHVTQNINSATIKMYYDEVAI